MEKIIENFKKTFTRLMVILAAGIVLGAGGLAAHGLLNYFAYTSYRFVSIFLLLILVSNVLAKLAISYIDA